MNKLYQGRLDQVDSVPALKELRQIERELADLPPSAVVWDAEDCLARPPWGDEVASHVKSMARYFVTKNGLDLMMELIENVEAMQQFGGTLEIVSYRDHPPF